jgi:hypothetical protein
MTVDPPNDLLTICHTSIREAGEFVDTFRAAQDQDPEPRSEAWREFYTSSETGPGGTWGPETARVAYSVGALGVMAAAQNLIALGQLLRPRQEVAAYGFEVITRAILEASARAWWIYEPSIGVRVRVARAKTVELHSANEGVKAEQLVPDRPRLFAAERERLLNEAEGLGLTFDYSNPPRRLLGFEGQRRPYATPIIKDLLTQLGLRDGAAVIFPNYSAVAHATTFAMLRNLEIIRKTPAMATVIPRPTHHQIANATVVALSAYLGVVARHAIICGFNATAVDMKRFTLCGPILQVISAEAT